MNMVLHTEFYPRFEPEHHQGTRLTPADIREVSSKATTYDSTLDCGWWLYIHLQLNGTHGTTLGVWDEFIKKLL